MMSVVSAYLPLLPAGHNGSGRFVDEDGTTDGKIRFMSIRPSSFARHCRQINLPESGGGGAKKRIQVATARIVPFSCKVSSS